MQFHLLSFEGPDSYARAGGLASRVDGLARSLSSLQFDTHLWFVGDPQLPGHEDRGALHLHRWCQWISRHHGGGVYDGEEGKVGDYTRSLPPFLLEQAMREHLTKGGHAVVLAEEWHTVPAVLELHELLLRQGLRQRVTMLWNANNTFGFERIDWAALSRAAAITTVSRYMKHGMQGLGVDPVVIPNGLSPDAFDAPDEAAVAELRRRFASRTVLVKMARFDPDKRWVVAMQSVREMKALGWRPLLVARGGNEGHGAEVRAAASAAGLCCAERTAASDDIDDLVAALNGLHDVDVVWLRSHVGADARRTLFHAADAVLANSGKEPFGLVGLETMAAGGLACTGCSGEDYAVAGRNAIVLQTSAPREFVDLYQRLRGDPGQALAVREAGRRTARDYAWTEVIEKLFLPRLELLHGGGPS